MGNVGMSEMQFLWKICLTIYPLICLACQFSLFSEKIQQSHAFTYTSGDWLSIWMDASLEDYLF